MNSEKEVIDYLEKFGLSEIESRLYLGLLESGPSTVLELSKHTNIKRTTAHVNIESLIEKGLVAQTKTGARRKLVAEPPKQFETFLENRKKDVSILEKNLPHVIESIDNAISRKPTTSDVKMRYYEGKKGVKLIYSEALKSNELRSYVNLEIVNSIFPENKDLFIEAQKKNSNLKIWEIVDISEKAKHLTSEFSQNERYMYKFATPSIELTAADVLLFDGNIGIVNVLEQTSGMVITNKEYYDTSKAIFDFVWKMLPESN